MQNKTFVLVAGMAIGTAIPAWAQRDPGGDPELTGANISRRGAELLADAAPAPAAALPAESPRFLPARPHRPDTAEGQGRLLPDGTFLVDQLGEVRASSTGAWIFSPHVSTERESIRPMVVLPSQILGRLQRVVGPDNTSASVRLTGRITLFYKQNYLLITAIADGVPIAADPTQPDAASPADQIDPDAERQDQAGNGLSEAVESLIEDLESERTGVRAVISGIGAGDESALAPIAEGRMISRRRGRFVRLDAGELAIAFDNDQAGGQSSVPLDAPLVIAPCSLLESIESTLETHGDAMTATVSGQTLAFAGRSFILPISVVIDRPGELDSRQ